jgi:hypothetical protein
MGGCHGTERKGLRDPREGSSGRGKRPTDPVFPAAVAEGDGSQAEAGWNQN